MPRVVSKYTSGAGFELVSVWCDFPPALVLVEVGLRSGDTKGGVTSLRLM